MSGPSERDITVYKAKLAEQAERYDEMADFMKQLVRDVNEPLSVEERNLLSVAFKNAVGARRAALRIINSLESKQKQRNQNDYIQITQEYQKKVTEELSQICKDIIELLEKYLLKKDSETEALVFYYKMQGDYFRYLCEFCQDNTKGDWIKKASDAYGEATRIASEKLTSTHPVRLGLALNFSVFHYEILAQPDAACKIAKSAFDEAISQLESVDEDSYRDSTLIMQLLRDNLTLWTTDETNRAGKEADEEAELH
eukprot:Protomagalhaensia_wolfi_Nauph_80__5448@NODE_595_length_2231_cov_251_313412_g446_i0_p2_GENE_NODE_595_length_2231_cov_251_313412_g446_i0NODE_595_length_2231_cov_251_313412_g446_i0_p2_ORF_typecomplete_len255_score39_311433/PF00244_20/1_4e95TINF2_N/PF14973_6/0_01WPP/PF13943_6/3_3WPP/PF13943_6/34HAUS6_N/PF14661_6/0_031DUF3810/PF12725_7/0_068FlaF/PF07309_11/2_3e03FlaF/PF07309_11/0_21Fib_alpha/PF08702_10/0_064Fib_alpha/PF08702_10/9_5e03eIF3_N/PF09440_10/0_87CENPK/PF11802_8/2_6CENPK/PF11802_8/1_9e03_NOD